MTLWETVIGLEVHVQLATRSKLFCGCSTAFGDPPNTNVCPTCLGLPGALPVTNERAIRLATRAALALEARVHEHSVFARKNYFYPDLPKGYQISQFDQPLATDGTVRFESPDRGPIAIAVARLHVEEDAGKSLHDRFPGKTAIDLNRAGVPLAEIVSGPDLRSPKEARAYLTTLKQLLIYAGVSDCSMEKGTLRVDANISVRRPGSPTLGTKTEIKNLNSFANVERALEAEERRQVAIVDGGGSVQQVTLLFDPATGGVHPMRSKEGSHDYRYFPDPDLPPVVVSPGWIAAERAALPELPHAKRGRFREEFGLSSYDAGVLASDPGIAEYFEALVGRGVEAKAAANWVMGDAMAAFNATGAFAVEPSRFAALIGLVHDGTLSQQAAKRVHHELASNNDEPRAVAERLGLIQVRDTAALEAWIEDVLAAHPAETARYQAGEVKLLGFLVGLVMKKSSGKADPKALPDLLRKRLS